LANKQRLELTWIGKENRPRLEPRILLEDPEKSYHAKQRVTENDIFDNRLIFGDNLLALKALEQEFYGAVSCIYIDPPYNTGSAFLHYDDGIEHSTWLSLMRDRLTILWSLLRPDYGSLWISIDDREMPYLRVLMDELAGRDKFIAQNVWQKRYSRDNNSAIGDVHEYVLVYARNPEQFKVMRNRVTLDSKSRSAYSNPNSDPNGPWQSISFTGEGFRSNMMYTIEGPEGTKHVPPTGRHWANLESEYLKLVERGRLWFGKDGKGVPRIIRYLSEVEGLVPWTWWPHDEVGHTDESKKESQILFGKSDSFSTPKPERLIRRIIEIASNPGDLILDSFAGSGTTGAVAHKLNRRWIMVELGEHAHTHVIPRLKKVIDGEDPGGVTEATGWKGGGGFRYFHIATSLLEKDRFGNLIISKQYNAAMLTEAMCKVMGFTYAPSDELYWQQGHSTENDFLYVTTQTLTRDQLAKLSDEVGETRSLLICCAAFRGKADSFPNLTIKKIPSAVLAKCEWGHDDYSLNVANLPKAAPAPEVLATSEEHPLTPKQARRKAAQPNLFATEEPGGAE
jgi:adenine-specific DNA-methyltransferase